MTFDFTENSQNAIDLAEFDDIDELHKIIDELWSIIDDIDSYGDMAKSDDIFFRKLVEKRQSDRWTNTNITSDGYKLFVKVNDD